MPYFVVSQKPILTDNRVIAREYLLIEEGAK